MYNKIILGGHLTRDIEVRYTQGGSAIGNTAIATSRKFKSATGEQKEEVLFVDLTFFGRTAEVANQYLRKGSKILVDGRLKLDQWTAQDGSKRSKHSVTVENLQMLDTKAESQGQGGQAPQGQGSQYGQPYAQAPQGQAPQGQAPQGQAPQGQAPQGQAPAQPEPSTIPEIDIDEGEIPF